MKQLQKNDLKEGDIYVTNVSHNNDKIHEFLNKHSLNVRGYGLDLKFKDDFRSDWYLSYTDMREATPEEKHWLETCIKDAQFVSYEEAMKTFIPEYVECIAIYGYCEIGEIYDTKDDNLAKSKCNLSWYKILVTYPNLNTRFKPSTKEAYDAQFVVKEPEFVLPKKWCLKITKENLDFCKSLENNELKFHKNYQYSIGGYYSPIPNKGCNGFINIPKNYTEITFEQFKKYVLKDEKETVTIKTTFETKSKFINNNTVETSEGSIFKVGDLVTPFENSSPNKGKKFKITGFRWNNSQTEICAITDLHKPYGIGVEKLEIYLEPKVKAEIVDDFVLPEKWQIKRTEENHEIINNWMNNHHKDKITYGTTDYISSKYFANNFNLSKIVNKEKSVIEITFEQFKKYVLKDE